MKKIIIALALIVGLAIPSFSFAANPQEQSFIDAYKKAYEAKDGKGLEALLYTKGADPMALQFYTMMMTADMGGKITSIELKDLTPEDLKKATEVMPSPNGGQSKLPVTPTKKLVLKIETADANGKSTSSSESYVANVDGKFLIPVPAPVK